MTRLAASLSLFAPLLLVAAGCGTTEVICDPVCPTGYQCTESGCQPVNPGGGVDLSTGGGSDLAMSCPQACVGATPYCNANRLCVPCLEDKHCPDGQICKVVGQAAACIPGCVDSSRCGAAKSCCNGTCIDTGKDVNNCGGCGTVCGSQHASVSCVDGKCVTGACSSGYGNCNADPKDGCETYLRADPDNCTACGMKCSIKNAIAACSGLDMPACYIAACNFGFDDCNADPKDGCETSVLSDAKNCGGCGMPCAAAPHAQVTCANAACQLTGCDQGYSDCNGASKDGCEVQTGTDANNCGACGNKCAQGLACINSSCTCQNCVLPNAKTKCVNFQCLFDVCLPGYGNCDSNPQNGCEVNFGSDAANCGSCGVACGGNTPFCAAGVCVAQPPCKNLGGGGLFKDNGLKMNELYCYNMGDNDQVRAQKACESHFGIGKCCVIMGGYNSQQYGDCNLAGGNGSIHWHYDNHPQGHCAPNYVVGDLVSPGWCGMILGSFL